MRLVLCDRSTVPELSPSGSHSRSFCDGVLIVRSRAGEVFIGQFGLAAIGVAHVERLLRELCHLV